MGKTDHSPRNWTPEFGVACFVLALVLFLGPLWWWALKGMSEDVSTAWIWTDFVLIPVLCAVFWLTQ